MVVVLVDVELVDSDVLVEEVEVLEVLDDVEEVEVVIVVLEVELLVELVEVVVEYSGLSLSGASDQLSNV